MQDWDRQNPSQIITELCGFITILSGTFLLHSTKDMGDNMTSGLSNLLLSRVFSYVLFLTAHTDLYLLCEIDADGYVSLSSPHSGRLTSMTKRPDSSLEESIPLRRIGELLRSP
jgi:hypothetical protein